MQQFKKYQGKKLRQLLIQHGSFEKVEGVVQRWHEQRKSSETNGGTVTRVYLSEIRKWTKCFASRVSHIINAVEQSSNQYLFLCCMLSISLNRSVNTAVLLHYLAQRTALSASPSLSLSLSLSLC